MGIWLDEDEFYEMVIVADVGDIIAGNYTVVDTNVSAPIMLLVLNSEHFSDWMNGSAYLFHVYRYSMSGEFSFPVPYADTWHVVFWNDPINSGAKHVIGNVDHLIDVITTTTTTISRPTTYTWESFEGQLVIYIIALGAVAAAIIVSIWIVQRDRDTEYLSRHDRPRSEGGIF
ncbi:MAG: hypothetical protein GQ580_07090 [Candidatus Thorarchaeota archaeon]|nr:hypothetical protein [Candidatus Thorarchaeota archaeon]